MRIAVNASELARWGWPCAKETECSEPCTGGMLYDVDWESCPIGEARKSQHIRILRGFQAQKRVCGTLEPRLPAWIVRDLDDLAAWEAENGAVSG